MIKAAVNQRIRRVELCLDNDLGSGNLSALTIVAMQSSESCFLVDADIVAFVVCGRD